MLLYKFCLKMKMKWRTFYWSFFFKRFGKDSFVHGKITVYAPENITLGSNSSLNEGCLINAKAPIKIGDHVHISPYAIINTATLDYTKIRHERSHIQMPIVIESGAWIGANAIINPGVTIGENSVVGAGAVVTGDVPANVVVVGVPARVIKNIESKKEQEEN